MADVKDILFFDGEHKWLSNFYASPVKYAGVVYPTVEHAYQAAKTLDVEERLRVQAERTPGGAKGAGSRLTLRPDWEKIKLSVMYDLLLQKFSSTDLVDRLLSTGDAHLEEGNTWYDTYWGVCEGKGYNHLGQLLMLIRSHQREFYY